MKDLFQEIYNKVLSLFNSSKEEDDPTKNLAVNRLKTILMQDRSGFSERTIQMLKEELTIVVSKYMEVDVENFELRIDADEAGKTLLNFVIPVLRPKTDEEIDAGIKEQELELQKKAQKIVKELEALIKERTQAMIEGEIDPALIEEAAKKASAKREENFEAEVDSDKPAFKEAEVDTSAAKEKACCKTDKPAEEQKSNKQNPDEQAVKT